MKSIGTHTPLIQVGNLHNSALYGPKDKTVEVDKILSNFMFFMASQSFLKVS